MMKRCLLIGIALVFVWTGCIKDEAELIPDHLEAQRFQPKDSVWAVSDMGSNLYSPESMLYVCRP